MAKEKKEKDTYSYKGWLISDNFVKRSFASLGYQMMATLFIYLAFIVIGVVLFCIGLLVSFIF